MIKTNEELIELAKIIVEQAEADAMQNPTSDAIQVVVVEPMKKPYIKTIPNTLEAMKDIVEGYIEILPIGKTEKGGTLVITLNEEGKLINKPFNRKLNGRGFTDILVGTFFITAFNMQGDNISISDEQCERMKKRFLGLDVYL
jgi:hypothetical protein